VNRGNTLVRPQQIEQLIQKLQSLPPRRVTEVEDFIDFLSQRDAEHNLTQAAMIATEPTSHTVWGNPDNAEYDNLWLR